MPADLAVGPDGNPWRVSSEYQMATNSSVPNRPEAPALSDDGAANENVVTLGEVAVAPPVICGEPRFVGRGRGAEVFAVDQSDGSVLARKVFVGSGLARVVHQIFFGADNPYVWDHTAMAEAVCRRRVLEPLVSWWLKGKARIARAHEASWNDDLNVNELSMEFIDGRPALLRQPYSDESVDEVGDLVNTVMKPLQTHLVEAGFDGAAWQAGLYNPVATSNFLRREKPDGTAEWVWIDAESGVPALFPANPLGLFKFYIPRSIKHGHPLFDDVDIGTLRRYLAGHESTLRAELGNDAWTMLMADVDALDAASQDGLWKRLSRVGRGIQARLTRKEIDDRQAAYYKRHPYFWVMREMGFALATTVQSIKKRLKAWFHPKVWTLILVESVKLMLSDRYRMAFARKYVAHNIERWRKRKQLDATQFDALQADLNDAASAVYLTDFGMHLAVKPLVKVITWGVFPFLYSVGVVDPIFLAVFVVGGGAISRSLYTLYRIVVAYFMKQSRPWVALVLGVLPVVGNIAFPVQLLFDGVRRGRGLSQFIVYDSLTRIGEFVPIWGGADTLTEHTANRMAFKAFALTNRKKP
jgi:hypothetical protein